MTVSRIRKIRIMPFLSIFSVIAARIIDPAIGPSTCSLWSHRCTPYNAILILKGILYASRSMLSDHDRFIVDEFSVIMVKFDLPVEF